MYKANARNSNFKNAYVGYDVDAGVGFEGEEELS